MQVVTRFLGFSCFLLLVADVCAFAEVVASSTRHGLVWGGAELDLQVGARALTRRGV